MKSQKFVALLGAGALTVALAACSDAHDSMSSAASTASSHMHSMGSQLSSAASSAASDASSAVSSAGSSAMSGMEHKMDGGQPPAGIKKAANPKFPVGTKVTIKADHMPGMNGADGTVVGAFTTTTYAVDYAPVSGGPQVKDHKWVVQEELEGVGDTKLTKGDTVTLAADHMPGMAGAKATIAEVTDQTVYMVDCTAGGMTIKNHKWVVEDELGSR